MLPRRYRLTKDRDIQRVFRRGKPVRHGRLVLKYARGSTDEIRFGFSVSKKVAKLATVRNRLKRQLRSLVSELLPFFPVGYDYHIILRPGGERPTREALSADLEYIKRVVRRSS